MSTCVVVVVIVVLESQHSKLAPQLVGNGLHLQPCYIEQKVTNGAHFFTREHVVLTGSRKQLCCCSFPFLVVNERLYSLASGLMRKRIFRLVGCLTFFWVTDETN